ncbi:hypothetical protein [Butyrivibrio sp. YAB3001]|uniref:hypothetical protein n=1 Tax=Butyrivibrio sp. YAB3001 TaxID=1520812 RepID=UPI0008F63EF1|nr:hypothetical protein [Butyrivibrio sp. YAB3001]SFB84730.1 hypothetical protein SAMN02910398_00855 [Butyrivibrio sp. YAB3001]
MKGNILGIFFTILSGILIALIVIAYSRSDRQEPEFRFSALNLTYDSQTRDQDLINGINAYDLKDGDLTSRIVVEKVVLNKIDQTAVVYYAVADYSGNVAKQSRVFPANIEQIEDEGISIDTLDAVVEEAPHPNLGGGEFYSNSGNETGSENSQEN